MAVNIQKADQHFSIQIKHRHLSCIGGLAACWARTPIDLNSRRRCCLPNFGEDRATSNGRSNLLSLWDSKKADCRSVVLFQYLSQCCDHFGSRFLKVRRGCGRHFEKPPHSSSNCFGRGRNSFLPESCFGQTYLWAGSKWARSWWNGLRQRRLFCCWWKKCVGLGQ